MTKQTALVFLQVGVPSVAALLSAYLGARLGVAKLRRERGFERRLTWYEGAIETTNRLSDAYSRVAHAKTEPERYAAWEALASLKESFRDLATGASRYGSRKVFRYLVPAVDELDRTLHTLPRDGAPESAEIARRMASLLARANVRLTHELREHLGFESLPGPVFYARAASNRVKLLLMTRSPERVRRRLISRWPYIWAHRGQ